MPGWFIHSEVAKTVAQHLSDPQNLPAQLNIDAAKAQKYGDISRIGAISSLSAPSAPTCSTCSRTIPTGSATP